MGKYNPEVTIEKTWILVMSLAILTGCSSNTENTMATDSSVSSKQRDTVVLATTDSATSITIKNGIHCFAYIKKKDSILMNLILKDSLVTGKLIYNLYEKDKNTGIFKGLLRNDTLLAIYTFSSERMKSVRQIVFLLKGNILVQGNGSMKEQNGKLVFSNRNGISFDGTIVLEQVACSSGSFK